MSPVVDDQYHYNHRRRRRYQNKSKEDFAGTRTSQRDHLQYGGRVIGGHPLEMPSEEQTTGQVDVERDENRERRDKSKTNDRQQAARDEADKSGSSQESGVAGRRNRGDDEWSSRKDYNSCGKRRRKRTYRRSLSQNIEVTSKSSGSRGNGGGLNIISGQGMRQRCYSNGSRESKPRAELRMDNRPARFHITRSNTDYDEAIRLKTITPSAGGGTSDQQQTIERDEFLEKRNRNKNKNKKNIATYLNDGSKDSTWLTNLVETQNESETDSLATSDCVFVDGRPASKWHSNQSAAAAAAPETQGFSQAGPDDYIVTCATAAITANFSVPLGSDQPRDKSAPIDEPNRKSLDRGFYLGQIFKYPRLIQVDSSVGSTNAIGATTSVTGSSEGSKQSTSARSDSFDLHSNFSKQRLTKSLPTDHSNSLRLSIDNLRTMAEKNLIATLIGVYILVSLAIIVVLIVPYIYNFRRQVDPHESGSTIENMDRLSYQRLSSSANKQTYEFRAGTQHTEDKSTQTGSSGLKLVKSQVDSAPNQPLDLTANGTSNSSASPSASSEDHPSPLPLLQEADDLSPTQTTNENLTTSRKDAKFSTLWQVKHSQQCQPMKIPFCSRSLGTILSETGLPLGRLDALSLNSHLVYDKTLLPNQFTQARQSQIERTLQKYEPIIDIKCYALMPLLVCSIYAPKCVQVSVKSDNRPTVSLTDGSSTNLPLLRGGGGGGGGGNKGDHEIQSANDRLGRKTATQFGGDQATRSSNKQAVNGSDARLVPPCRSLCKDAFRKCMFFFEVLSLKFLDHEDCDSLPESSDPLVCVGQLENELLQRAAGSENCGEDKFRCTDGECISKKWRCDGFNDCTDKSDETNCSKCNALSQFYCGQDVCIKKEQVCNGIRDCRDGRDERQCLRLSHGVASSIRQSEKTKRHQQLQAWSAVKDQWVPVCGAHWSAMPMSHQACQALGYSRANETLILYGSANYHNDERSLGQKNVSGRVLLRPARFVSSTRILDEPVEKTMGQQRDRRSPGGWFDVSSGDSFTHSDTKDDDKGEQMASIVEDMAASGSDSVAAKGASRLDVSQKVADHMIHFEQVGAAQSSSGASVKGGAGGGTRKTGPDLASIDAAEIKLKSLTSMLYYGPEAGCLGRPSHLVSSVQLQCQNFQCGRSISSYSTRVRLQQWQAKLASTSASSSSSSVSFAESSRQPTDSVRIAPALRSALGESNLTNSHYKDDTSIGDERIQRLEATEELLPVDDDDADNDNHNGDELYEHENTLVQRTTTDQRAINRTSSEAGQSIISSRLVVGGIESMPGEFPYLAALHGGPDEVFFCGGVLISINWLLTAAHCVGNRTQPDGWMVKVGVTRRIASPAFVKKLKVRKIIKHQDFNKDSMFNNDIALILLEESVEYNQYLRPICLPVANLKLGPDNSKDCVVVGFGKSKFSQEANYLHVAHFVNVPIVHRSICSNWYAEHGVNLTEGMLCAGYAEGKRDACQGDSGSGLFCRYSNTNQFFVAGVVSFGIKCATPKLPGVYTSVPLYVDWIEQVTRQHGYAL